MIYCSGSANSELKILSYRAERRKYCLIVINGLGFISPPLAGCLYLSILLFISDYRICSLSNWMYQQWNIIAILSFPAMLPRGEVFCHVDDFASSSPHEKRFFFCFAFRKSGENLYRFGFGFRAVTCEEERKSKRVKERVSKDDNALRQSRLRNDFLRLYGFANVSWKSALDRNRRRHKIQIECRCLATHSMPRSIPSRLAWLSVRADKSTGIDIQPFTALPVLMKRLIFHLHSIKTSRRWASPSQRVTKNFIKMSESCDGG